MLRGQSCEITEIFWCFCCADDALRWHRFYRWLSGELRMALVVPTDWNCTRAGHRAWGSLGEPPYGHVRAHVAYVLQRRFAAFLFPLQLLYSLPDALNSCRVVIILYSVYLVYLALVVAATTLTGDGCDASDAVVAASINDELDSPANVRDLEGCPDYTVIYIGLVLSLVSGLLGCVGATGAICGCCPPAAMIDGHPAKHPALHHEAVARVIAAAGPTPK